MKKYTTTIAVAVLVLGTPLLALAAGKDLKGIMDIITGYMQNFIKLIISLAILTFVWNVYKYYFKADADRAEAGKYVLYSVIGFFVILSFWGLVNILDRTFNLDKNQPAWPFNVNSGGGGAPSSQTNRIIDPTTSADDLDSPDADYLREINGQ